MKYDGSVVIVSSVDLEWSRPSYTGYRGVSVMNYTVSSNGGTVVVSDDSEVVRYTSQSLIYGDVLVSAINSCGQESTPVLLNIPASGIATSCMVFSFDMSIQNHLNWSNRVWRYTTIMLL